MWKSAYVGVYQLLNWKMHGEILKFFCSIFILFWVCYFLPNFTTSCSAEVKAALTGNTGRKTTIIPATNAQLAWQHIHNCHVTGPCCISTLNLCTTHNVRIHFGLSCASCECSQKTACLAQLQRNVPATDGEYSDCHSAC